METHTFLVNGEKALARIGIRPLPEPHVFVLVSGAHRDGERGLIRTMGRRFAPGCQTLIGTTCLRPESWAWHLTSHCCSGYCHHRSGRTSGRSPCLPDFAVPEGSLSLSHQTHREA